MSVGSAKAKLDAQGGDPPTGYISKQDVKDSYDELVADTALSGATTVAGTINGRDPDDLVKGPASATDNALVRFDGTGGKTVQGSGITVDDSGNISSDLTVSKASPTLNVSASSGSAIVQASAATAATAAFRWRSGSGTTVKWAWIRDTDDGLYLYRYPSSGVINTVIDVSTGKWTFRDVGATAGLELGSSGPRIMSGTGSPEGVVTAPVGSQWTDTAATTGAIRWIKTSGTGNTGWVVEYGDTGLRNLSAETLLNGWTIYAYFNLRRVGNMVEVNLWPDKTSASADSVYTIPSGFRPAVAYARFTQATNVDDDYCRGYIMSTGDFRVLRSTMTGAIPYIYLTYVTSDPWPSTLPGT